MSDRVVWLLWEEVEYSPYGFGPSLVGAYATAETAMQARPGDWSPGVGGDWELDDNTCEPAWLTEVTVEGSGVPRD